MSEQKHQSQPAGQEPAGESELSPAEKLADSPPMGEPIPGVENPVSTEIKQEQGPNTE